MLYDKIIYNKNLSVICSECYTCKKFGHFTKDCPLLHYSPDIENVILKGNFSVQHKNREIYPRFERVRVNSKLDL